LSGEERPFPPSDHKLKKLRSQGIVPWSHEWMLCFAWCGVVLGLFVLASLGRSSLQVPLRQVIENPNSEPVELIFQTLRIFVRAAWTILLPLLLAILLGGAFQTGFLFSMQAFGKRGNSKSARGERRVARLLMLLSSSLAWLGIVSLVLRQGLLRIESESVKPFAPVKALSFWTASLVPDSELFSWNSIAAQLRDKTFYFIILLLGFTMMLGSISRFIAVLSFRGRHSMSRADMEAENRELEMSPELRRKISQLSEE